VFSDVHAQVREQHKDGGEGIGEGDPAKRLTPEVPRHQDEEEGPGETAELAERLDRDIQAGAPGEAHRSGAGPTCSDKWQGYATAEPDAFGSLGR
jgi:hypothetical protein